MRKALLFFIFGLSTHALGQSEGTGSLSGRILDAETLQPIADDAISLILPPKSYEARSDANGNYSFSDLPPGIGILHNAGLLRDRIPVRDSVPIRVRAGDKLTEDFLLIRSASVAGSITDRESGKPVSGLTILIHNAKNPWPAIRDKDGARVDAKGRFDFGRLRSGRYFLELAPRTSEYDPAKTGTLEGYGNLFYPGVSRMDMAVPIVIGSGERRELEWQVVKQELFTVAGRVESEREAEFFLCRGDRIEMHGFLAGGGPFRLSGLSRGAYRLLMRTTEKGPEDRLWGGVDLELGSRDIGDLKIELSRGLKLQAKPTFAGEEQPVPGQMSLRLVNIDFDPRFITYFPPGDPLTNYAVPPGRYWARLTGVPGGMAISGLVTNGVESERYALLTLTADTVITYRISKKPGMIAGSLRDGNGKAVSGGVTLVPESLPPNFDPAAVRRIEADADGKFQFANLAPGRYKVTARTRVETVEIRENEVRTIAFRR